MAIRLCGLLGAALLGASQLAHSTEGTDTRLASAEAYGAPGLVVNGLVEDCHGAPLPHATVTLRPKPTADGPTGGDRTTTDASGGFSFSEVARGDYVVAIEWDAGGHRVHTIAAQLVRAWAYDLRPLIIRLPHLSAITGRVESEDSRPEGGVLVEALPKNKALREQNPVDPSSPPPRGWSDTTSSDGSFHIDELPDGDYDFRLTGSDTQIDWHASTQQVVSPSGDILLKARYRGMVRGQVARFDGMPIDTIWILGEPHPVVDGGFSVDRIDVPNDVLEIQTRDTAAEVVTLDQPPVAGDRYAGAVVLEPGTQVVGRVIDALDGKPIAGARVQLPTAVEPNRRRRGPWCGNAVHGWLQQHLAPVVTDSTGEFVFPHVSRRATALVVTRVGYLDAEIPVPGANRDLLVRLIAEPPAQNSGPLGRQSY